MTAAPDSTRPPESAALVPPAPVDVTQLRVTQAELSRFVGCSRQTVSQWAKRGLVTFAAHDARANLGEAIRQIVERADPRRLRIRAFRDLVREHDALRQRNAALERRLQDADAQRAAAVTAVGFGFADRLAVQVADLQRALIERFDVLTAARARRDLPAALDALIDAIFYPDARAPAEAADAEADSPPPPTENPDDEAEPDA